MAAIFVFQPEGEKDRFQIIAEDWDEAAQKMAFCLHQDGQYDSVSTIFNNGVVKILTVRKGRETIWVPDIEKD